MAEMEEIVEKIGRDFFNQTLDQTTKQNNLNLLFTLIKKYPRNYTLMSSVLDALTTPLTLEPEFLQEKIVEEIWTSLSILLSYQPPETLQYEIFQLLQQILMNASPKSLRAFDRTYPQANATYFSNNSLLNTEPDFRPFKRYIYAFTHSSTFLLEHFIDTSKVLTSEWISCIWEKHWDLLSSPQVKSCAELFIKILTRPVLQKMLTGVHIPLLEPVVSEDSWVGFLSSDAVQGPPQQAEVGTDIFLIKAVGAETIEASVEDKKASLDTIRKRFSEGYSIGIRSAHARNYNLACGLASIEERVGHQLNANVYWTPPGEQGLATHFDDHCVFVVQLSGRKRWHLSSRVHAMPLLYCNSEWQVGSENKEDTHVIEMRPGLVLYIPRGTLHHADTLEYSEDSIHVTMGVEIPLQWTKEGMIHALIDFHHQKHPNDTDLFEHKFLILHCIAVELAKLDISYFHSGLMQWDTDKREDGSSLSPVVCKAAALSSQWSGCPSEDDFKALQKMGYAFIPNALHDIQKVCRDRQKQIRLQLPQLFERMLHEADSAEFGHYIAAKRQKWLIYRQKFTQYFAQLHRDV